MLTMFLIVFVDLVGFGIIIPLLPFYAEYFQAEPDTVTLVMATYSLTQFIAAPFWGNLSDRIGRKPVLIISLLGAALAYVLLGFADTLWMLFAARALGGFMAGNISAAFAYMADITTPENRAKGMGLVGAAFGLGFIAGPAIGGILAGPDPVNADYQTPAFAAAGLSLIALSMAVVLLKESLSKDVRAKLLARGRQSRLAQFQDAIQKPGMGLLIALSFLSVFVFAGMESTFAMWSRRQFNWGPEQNGWLFACVGLLAAVIQGGLVGKLAKRFGEARLVITGAAFLAFGMGLLPFAGTIPILAASMGAMAFGFSIMTPSLNSLISLSAGEEEQGSIMGVTRSASTMARVIGPALAGVLFAGLGLNWPYYFGAVVMVLVAGLAARKLNH